MVRLHRRLPRHLWSDPASAAYDTGCDAADVRLPKRGRQVMAKARIGFIGVGLMGHGIAKNIVEKGYPLTVLGHRNRQPVEDLVKRGAVEADSPSDLARRSDIIFLYVTNSPQV